MSVTSTPFGTLLHELRQDRGLRQKTLAHAVGVAPSHLSQVERGSKGPFNHAVLGKIKVALALNGSECRRFDFAAAISRRSFTLPSTATAKEFAIAALLACPGEGAERYMRIARLALDEGGSVSDAEIQCNCAGAEL